MKKHLAEGELRASLDGELDDNLLRHLNACTECQAQLNQLKQAHLRIANQLAFLTPGAEPVPSVRSAWSRFTSQYLKQKETSMLKKWFSFPVIRAGAIAVLSITLLMAFPTTRALAGQLLNLFRVQQVEATIVYGSGRCDLAAERDYWDIDQGRYVCGFNPTGIADDQVVVGKNINIHIKNASKFWRHF